MAIVNTSPCAKISFNAIGKFLPGKEYILQGFLAQRVFWGKGKAALCEIALCESYFSTKVQTWGKNFSKVNFLSIFSSYGLVKWGKLQV